MKYLFYLLLILTLFFSCKSNRNAPKAFDTINKSASINSNNPLIDEFKPIIQGSWVCKEYIDEIAKTKSPYIARQKMGNIATMLIDSKFIKGDSLKIEVGYGNHEGGELMLKFHHGKAKRSIMTYSPSGLADAEGDTFALGYDVGKSDTILILYTFNKAGKLSEVDRYFRIFKNEFQGHELGNSTYYVVNKVLIAGKYLMSDTLNNTSKIDFDNYGNVTGFPNAKTYLIDIDFETPPGNNMDQIDFDIQDKNNQTFAFKFNHDTLNLFQVSFDKDSIDYILGKRVYKLVRQK